VALAATGDDDMWFWCFIVALCALMFAAIVFQKFFWGFITAAGVTICAGLVIEGYLTWREERFSSPQVERRGLRPQPNGNPKR
jgi:hypothetical protein